jgi:hypothetical protein
MLLKYLLKHCLPRIYICIGIIAEYFLTLKFKISPQVQRPEREDDYSSHLSAKVRILWNLLPVELTALWCSAQLRREKPLLLIAITNCGSFLLTLKFTNLTLLSIFPNLNKMLPVCF